MINQFCLKADLVCVSPLCISSGVSGFTDNDVLTDASGQPFVPGSSLAGACRHYLEACGLDVEIVFGNRDSNEDSRIVFYEAFLKDNKGVKNFRNGVALDEQYGTALEGSHFDYEILESGTVFSFRMTLDMQSDAEKELVARIVWGINNGEIRIGGKTTRGMGRMELKNIYYQHITDIDALVDFSWDAIQAAYVPEFQTEKLYRTYTYDFDVKAFTFVSDRATLHAYDTDRVVNAEQLKDVHGNSIVPASTWAGVFRHRMHRVLGEVGYEQKDDFLDKLFGNENRISSIIFEDAKIVNDTQMIQTRNAIDRFTGGAGDKKLFTNRISFGGMVSLTVHIKTPALTEAELSLAEQLLDVCVQDVYDGIIYIGGQGSVGGGLFVPHKEGQI